MPENVNNTQECLRFTTKNCGEGVTGSMENGLRVREAVGARREEGGCGAGLAEVLVGGIWLDGLRCSDEKERDVLIEGLCLDENGHQVDYHDYGLRVCELDVEFLFGKLQEICSRLENREKSFRV